MHQHRSVLSTTPNGASPGPGATVVPLPGGVPGAALLEGLRRGETRAKATFFDRYARRVERVLYSVLGPDAEIPDLVQEVFLGALRGVRRYRGDAAGLEAWLVRITVLTARKALRRRRARRWLTLRDPEEMPDLPSHSLSPDRALLLSRSFAVLNRLQPKERLVLALRFVEEMGLDEVADACGISRATASRWLARARQRAWTLAKSEPALQEWLSKSEEGNDD
jgi:RNA polymerase sigma-70 factor (ECF subfamily)